MKATVFNSIGKHLAMLWATQKLFFSTAGRRTIKRENHDKHYWYTALIAIVITTLLIVVSGWYDNVFFDYVAIVIVVAFFGWVINAAREEYNRKRGGKNGDGTDIVPFDFVDVASGTLAAIHWSTVTIVALLYFFG